MILTIPSAPTAIMITAIMESNIMALMPFRQTIGLRKGIFIWKLTLCSILCLLQIHSQGILQR